MLLLLAAKLAVSGPRPLARVNVYVYTAQTTTLTRLDSTPRPTRRLNPKHPNKRTHPHIRPASQPANPACTELYTQVHVHLPKEYRPKPTLTPATTTSDNNRRQQPATTNPNKHQQHSVLCCEHVVVGDYDGRAVVALERDGFDRAWRLLSASPGPRAARAVARVVHCA